MKAQVNDNGVYNRSKSTRYVLRLLRFMFSVLETASSERVTSNLHTGHWNGVREAHLGWLVNEYHVAGLSPRIWIVDDISTRINTTRSLLLKKSYHAGATGASVNP